MIIQWMLPLPHELVCSHFSECITHHLAHHCKIIIPFIFLRPSQRRHSKRTDWNESCVCFHRLTGKYMHSLLLLECPILMLTGDMYCTRKLAHFVKSLVSKSFFFFFFFSSSSFALRQLKQVYTHYENFTIKCYTYNLKCVGKVF